MEIFRKAISNQAPEANTINYTTLISPENSSSKNLSIQISILPPEQEQPYHAHEPEQCYYILKGKGAILIEEEIKEVVEGDAIYIPSNQKHGIKNTGDTVLEYLSFNTPMSLASHKLGKMQWNVEPV